MNIRSPDYPKRRIHTVAEATQMFPWSEQVIEEDPAYLAHQLITYIGNKRALLGNIGEAINKVKNRLGRGKLRVFDAFSGSGVVSRFLKAHSSYLACNDIEDFSTVLSRCYLTNRSSVNMKELDEIVAFINSRVDQYIFSQGFIEELYAPVNEEDITHSDRVFYSKKNARRIDDYRRMIELAPAKLRDLLLAPLLSEASIHANTSGVFKGFYKDNKTKIGKFGGSNRDALSRILGEIHLETPLLSLFECDFDVFQEDASIAVKKLRELDLAYFDPPYNQHPYGSNYFMLNLIVNYRRPGRISRVSGIPEDWKRSEYNVKSRSFRRFSELLHATDAKFLLISFNNEGFIKPADMLRLLNKLGKVELVEIKYNAFRGSRNFNNRSIHVTEQLFLVEKQQN